MKKTNLEDSPKSTESDRVLVALTRIRDWAQGESRSACSCLSRPIVGPTTTSWKCPRGMPWECMRQLELFPADVGTADTETELPPLCNTGVTRPESAQGEQKAYRNLRRKKAGSK